MDMNVWTAGAVRNAILQNSGNLELVFSNYLKVFVARLGEYGIGLQGVTSVEQLAANVLDGIESLEVMRKEFLSVIEMFTACRHPFLKKYLPDFLGSLLNAYEEKGISLYYGSDADSICNDHYRFFNQSLIISLTSLLLENQCFDALGAMLSAKFAVRRRNYCITEEVNYLSFREYNHTLNVLKNTTIPKRISVTADYIMKYSERVEFAKLVRADILLYYMSLWHYIDGRLAPYWLPELSVYNREKFIIPELELRSYFAEAKCLFGVDTVEQYKALLDKADDNRFQRAGVYRVPQLKIGLMYDSVGSKA